MLTEARIENGLQKIISDGGYHSRAAVIGDAVRLLFCRVFGDEAQRLWLKLPRGFARGMEDDMAIRSSYVIYTDTAGEIRWRLVAGNGRTISDSGEGYKTVAGCEASIERHRLAAQSDRVINRVKKRGPTKPVNKEYKSRRNKQAENDPFIT